MVLSRMLAALALLGVVAIASTAQLESGKALSPSQPTVLAVLIAVAAVVIGLGAIAIVGSYAVFSGKRRELLIGLLVTALFAAVVALMFMPTNAPRDEGNPLPTRKRPPPARVLEKGSSGSDVAAIAAALVAGTALLGAVLALVGAKVRADRRRRRQAAALEEEEAVLEAVEQSLDDLHRERDVRRAIIACYARMERALDRAGNGRRPAEAPFEYLARVLQRITANGSAARVLTELFEHAKFGAETMDEREKDRAIGALELLRAEVSQPP
jgi:Domain of unknown function (DUF4129)